MKYHPRWQESPLKLKDNPHLYDTMAAGMGS